MPLTLRVRLIAAIVTVVVVAASVALGYAMYVSSDERHQADAVVTHQIRVTSLLRDARVAFFEQNLALAGYFALRDAQYLEAFADARDDANTRLLLLRQIQVRVDPDAVPAIDTIAQEHRILADQSAAILGVLGDGTQADVIEAADALNYEERATAFVGAIDDAVDDANAALVDAQRRNETTQQAWTRIVMGIAGGWAFVVLACAYATYRWVVGPIFRERERMLSEALAVERDRALHDGLTGLFTHAIVMDRLKDALPRSKAGGAPLALAMVDIDGVKAINDTYGHLTGDAVLRTVANRLLRNDVTVGRYGGDEFVVIMPGADRAKAEEYRRQVVRALQETELLDSQTGEAIPIVISMGLAVYPEEADNIEALLQLSDSAMYEWRRQNPRDAGPLTPPTPLADDRAARMIGEIVPLLTSPGELDEKLRLVAHHLSVGVGYDAVSFSLYDTKPDVPVTVSTFARVAPELIEAWNRDQTTYGGRHAMPRLLESIKRPVILHDPLTNPTLAEAQKRLLEAAGICCGLVAPMFWRERLVGVIAVGSKRERAFGPRDAQFLTAVATQVTAIVRMSLLVDDLQAATNRLEDLQADTVMMLAAAAEAHDETTGLHLQRLRHVTRALAVEMSYEPADADRLGLAAVLHDIGKVRVPDSILAWPGTLDSGQWEIMCKHTVWGESFLASRAGFELAASIARHHHERWDGGGYPDRLSGDAIPESAAIVTVADAFDAITHDRPYRQARSALEAMEEIRAGSGTQFSPRVVETMTRLYERGALAEAEDERQRAAA